MSINTISTSITKTVILGNSIYASDITITNTGTVIAPSTDTSIAPYGVAVYAVNLSAFALNNQGTIISNENGITGIRGTLEGDGTVINSGLIHAGSSGIVLGVTDNSIDNSGTISAGRYGIFVYYAAPDNATNHAQVSNSGIITSVGPGVYIESGTVLNTGTILSHHRTGVQLHGGTLINTGNIQGSYGVYVPGGGTVQNAGTITGSAFAIEDEGDDGSSFSLIVDPGAVFNGTVTDLAKTGTLDLAGATAGTLNVGGSFGGFSNISFGSNAWTLSGIGTEFDGEIFGGGPLITGFKAGDVLNITDLSITSGTQTLGPNDILTLGSDLLTFSAADTGALFAFSADPVSGTDITVNALCFARSTCLHTPSGKTPVEKLKIGDEILTVTGKVEKIEWMGQRSYDARFAAKNHLVRPVCIKTDAVAAGVPARDLYVSPGHGIFIDGVLVPAWRLINGKTITQPEIAQAEISYYHVELASHAVILAENCPAETYLDTGSRNQFQNAATYSKCAAAVTPLPRVESGVELEAIRAKLNARAGIETRGENPANAVIGYVDHVGANVVSGWALCPDDPETPVCLDVYFWLAGTLNRKPVLANLYRADLRKAGLGSGCHGFEAELPDDAAGARVLRAVDRTPLALADAAMESVFAA